MVLNVHKNHKAYQGREEGEGGYGEGGGRGGGGRWRYGGGGRLYTYPYCQYQNDSCFKMGSDESHYFNVSLIVRDKATRQCPQTTTFLMRKESRSGFEPRPFCLAA